MVTSWKALISSERDPFIIHSLPSLQSRAPITYWVQSEYGVSSYICLLATSRTLSTYTTCSKTKKKYLWALVVMMHHYRPTIFLIFTHSNSIEMYTHLCAIGPQKFLQITTTWSMQLERKVLGIMCSRFWCSTTIFSHTSMGREILLKSFHASGI